MNYRGGETNSDIYFVKYNNKAHLGFDQVEFQ